MTFYGVHTTQTPAETAADFPGVTVDRVFLPGVQPVDADLIARHARYVGPHYAAGITPVVSLKLDPAKLGSHAYGSQIHDYADYLAEQPDTWLIYWHEPENDMDGRTFARAFETFKAAFAHTGETPVGYAAMAYQWRAGMPSTAAPADWRVEAADFYSVDVYTPSHMTYREDAGFRRWFTHNIADAPGPRQWWITERGFKGARLRGVRQRTISREFAALDAEPVPPSVYIWWNTPGAEHDTSIPLDRGARLQLAREIAARA